MRLYWPVALLALITACTDSGEAESGAKPSTGGGPATGGGPSGGGGGLSGASGSTAMSGGGGMAGTSSVAGSGGGATGPFACTSRGDECPTGSECYVALNPDDTYSSSCVPPGTVAEGQACTKSSDCLPDLFCGSSGTCVEARCFGCSSCGILAAGPRAIGELCLPSCSRDGDCREGMTCRNRTCRYGGGAAENEPCAHSLACANGLTCTVGGTCVRACDQRTDCLGTEYCTYPLADLALDDLTHVPELSVADGVCTTPCFGIGVACPNGRCQRAHFGNDDPGAESGACGTAGPAGENEACAADLDCGANLSCSGYPDTTGGLRCFQHCATSADCPAGRACGVASVAPLDLGLCFPTCDLVAGTGCSTDCKPGTTADDSLAPLCSGSKGSTCAGGNCNAGCINGTFCVDNVCRRACLADGDCANGPSSCASDFGTTCTGMLSESVRYCQ